MLYIITGIVIVAFIFSMLRDNRSMWNPALLIIGVFFSYLSLVQLFYTSGDENVYMITLAAGFLGVPFLVFLSGIFLIYNGFVLLKREGKSKVNYLSLGMGILIIAFYIMIFVRAYGTDNYIFYQNPWLNIFFIFVIYSYIIFGFAFAGFLLYSLLYNFIPKGKNYDFIIIHGAGLLNGERVTPLLKRRIDKAVEAFKKSRNSNIKLIASGGQGADEKISEARAIFNYLMEETDVPGEAVLMEDQSKTTYQNLLFSKKLGESLVENPRFLFVTNDYHVFRTSTYAKKIGIRGDGLGCSTASYYLPSAFIREYVALCVKMKWMFAGFYALLIIAIAFSYHGILW
ncbi:YdcF family protein [Catonella morbi]|nr:YdcF family protein [Catonella morbi]